MILYTTAESGGECAERLIAQWASVEDIAQASTKSAPARQHEFLVARAILRALLYEVTKIKDWHIQPDVNGKPLIFSSTDEAGPHVSLSHTKGIVACTVSTQHPIGIDIEYWRDRDFAALAHYAFTPEESALVAREGKSAFYRLWTLKEAKAKMKGIGIFAEIKEAQERNILESAAEQVLYKIPATNYSLTIIVENSGALLEKIVEFNLVAATENARCSFS